MTFHVHHQGEFTEDKYVGGLLVTVKDFDLDVFSYSELMEWVKDLGYTEIGGVYVREESNGQGWQLLLNDKDLSEYTIASGASELDLYIDSDANPNVEPMPQMQPHVTIRPKRTPVLKSKEGNPKKHHFVTLRDINQEKSRKMNINSRKKINTTDKVLKATVTEEKFEKVSKAAVMEEKSDSALMGLEEYCKRFEILPSNKMLGEGAGQSGITDYEMLRCK